MTKPPQRKLCMHLSICLPLYVLLLFPACLSSLSPMLSPELLLVMTIEWLVSRRILESNWQEKLSALQNRVAAARAKLPVSLQSKEMVVAF